MDANLKSVLSKYFKDDAIRFLREHPQYFAEIAEISLTKEKPYCWRASWLIKSVMVNNDKRVLPYVDSMIGVLPKLDDGHQREMLHVIRKMKLDDEQQSLLYDACVTLWESPRKKPGTRHTAFGFISTMIEQYPELMAELRAITQPQHLNSLSPGVRSSIRKEIARLEKHFPDY